MSKYIKMTEELRQQCIEEFADAITNGKFANGKINYSKTLMASDRKATVIFEPEAFVKMMSLVMKFGSEVAWHGLATRDDDEEKDVYYIHDIIVYPQTVTGATVNTDQKEYEEWYQNLDDDTFNMVRMQGHSHVNMSTSPSGVDEKAQQDILDALPAGMFYIFMIWNKSLEYNAKIYDLKKNILFETHDIDVDVMNTDIGNFLKDANDMVKKTTYSYTGSYSNYSKPAATSGSYSTTPNTSKPAVVSSKPAEKEKEAPIYNPDKKKEVNAGYGSAREINERNARDPFYYSETDRFYGYGYYYDLGE